MVRRFRLALGIGLLAALTLGFAGPTAAGAKTIFASSMVGLPTGSLVLDGLTGGGVPWAINAGRAILTEDGRLSVSVQGLVVASSGVNPVTSGRAVVVCAGVPVAFTDTVPFSGTGNAQVTTTVSLPETCLDLAVFFTNASNRWFAVTGS